VDWKKNVTEYYYLHKGAIIGCIIGLIIGIAFLVFGFLKVLFVVLCACAGYFLGRYVSEGNDFIMDIKSKLFPQK